LRDLDEGALARIDALTTVDRALYRHALATLLRRIGARARAPPFARRGGYSCARRPLVVVVPLTRSAPHALRALRPLARVLEPHAVHVSRERRLGPWR
jgi:hypothetical protein